MDLDTPCKIWTGAVEKTGYGRRKVNGKMWMAHRYSYQEHYGDLEPDLVVDHLCFNRSCVEPAHLRQITREENAVRHNPDCTCVKHRPELYALSMCHAGHDITRPDQRTKPGWGSSRGKCLECFRKRNREHMRAARLAAVA